MCTSLLARSRPNVRFHAEIPLVAFLGLVHFRVALLFLVLGGGWRGDERGIHQRAFPQQQAARGEVGVDGGEKALAQVVRFQQVPEVQQGGGIGHAFGGQINPGKTLEGVAVVERVFERLVGEGIPLLEKIDAQHPLQTNGRAAAFALRIKGFDDGEQLRPGDDLLHAGEELFAAGDFLFGGKLGVGEAGLVRHAPKFKPTAPQRRLQFQAN